LLDQHLPRVGRRGDERFPQYGSLDVVPEDSFTVGVLDDPEKSIDLDFCRQKGIVVLRRNTTGGTIYAGRGSGLICYYLRLSEPGVPQTIGEAFPKFLGDFAQGSRELFGFPAQYRPLNDVEVEGRKLMPTSCKIEQDTLVLQVVLNVKPQDAETPPGHSCPGEDSGQGLEGYGGEVHLPGGRRQAGRVTSGPGSIYPQSGPTVLWRHPLTPESERCREKEVLSGFQGRYLSRRLVLANSESFRFKNIPGGGEKNG
jgi:hypothetical protein